ncbi:MAG: hypothetical protein Q8S54_05705 [Bacteroidota bacterium]|nr:hypothetical protein [Odoribacter sp.]MDP3642673.1 hypothetical protein [Bacteroidota bacterium]
MEDYIFLIIAIVLTIFGAINKKKKNTENANPLTEKAPRPKNFFMDQLLGENFLGNPVEEIKPPVRVKPVLRTEPAVSPKPVGPSRLIRIGFKSTLPEQKKKPIQTLLRKAEVENPEERTDNSDSPGYLEDFSLRKAFVYSEIMQRKY